VLGQSGRMPQLSVDLDDFLWYVDQALDSMRAVLADLGDDRANRRPPIPGANSAYAIVTHCLGVMEFWGGAAIAGRTVERDRAAEFVATGAVGDLVDRMALARQQLRRDLERMDCAAPPRRVSDPEDVDLPLGRSQGGVALHIYEELSQHLGQLELTRDLVRTEWPRTGG
jgi:hypothetical protein